MAENDNRMVLRQLHNRVVRHMEDSQKRWRDTPGGSWEDKERPFKTGLEVFVEELGKFARCDNKLSIVDDPAIRKQWLEEREHRLISCVSMLYRMHLAIRGER